jgi:hypothetical protein
VGRVGIVTEATSIIVGVLGSAIGFIGASTPVAGEDDITLVGTYSKDHICRGDGSDPADILVKITGKVIEFNIQYGFLLYPQPEA